MKDLLTVVGAFCLTLTLIMLFVFAYVSIRQRAQRWAAMSKTLANLRAVPVLPADVTNALRRVIDGESIICRVRRPILPDPNVERLEIETEDEYLIGLELWPDGIKVTHATDPDGNQAEAQDWAARKLIDPLTMLDFNPRLQTQALAALLDKIDQAEALEQELDRLQFA